jgi:hypothetical protein
MPSFRRVKIETLEVRLENLIADYQAASRQISLQLDEVSRQRLQRQIESLEQDIETIEAELAALRAEGDPDIVSETSLHSASSGSASSLVSPATGEVNTGVLRQLLLAAFDDEDFTNFCFDHFPEVHNRFSGGMSRSSKVQELIDFCQRRLLFGNLLALIQSENPAQYQKFSSFLFDS